MTEVDHLPRFSPGAQRMRRYRRRREAGQQCITLTLHEYQVWGLVACGFLAEDQRQKREAVADALLAYLSEYTIRASHLNTLDPVLSIQHKFDGKLRRQKKGTQDFTSLALFCDDVEYLLHDLYGDVESDALDSIVWAVFHIVDQFTKYVRPDLCKEQSDAEDLDYIFGIGVPDGSTINGSDSARGMVAKRDLILRVYEVQQEPSAFSDYTIDFANRFSQ